MSSDPHSDLSDWDAAYVLGALTPSDRRRFETHLASCAACRDSVADFSGLPGLLAAVPEADVDRLTDGRSVTDAPPPDLLPKLAVAVRRHRRRRHFAGAGGVLAAAAAVVVAVVLLWPGGSTTPAPTLTTSGSSSSPDQAGPLQLTPLTSGPLTVAVTLVPQPWGTRIDLECRFGVSATTADPSPETPETYDYALFVTDRSGSTEPAGSWSYTPGTASTEPVGGSSRAVGDIATVEARTDDGQVLLRGAF